MRTLKLMADYQCYPLWEGSTGSVGNVDPASLPISKDLIARLNQWARAFDQTFNINDPLSSGFSSEAMEREFLAEGRNLRSVLQVELGINYVIIYD